jgi:DNA-binding MarR family transcriptional regulator
MHAEESNVRGPGGGIRRGGTGIRRGSEKLPPDARLFAHPRLEIAAAIARRAGVSFRHLCDELELSDGNLSAHLRALENETVIEVERTFDGRRRLSQYRLTEGGRERLRAYAEWVESFARALYPHVGTAAPGASVVRATSDRAER